MPESTIGKEPGSGVKPHRRKLLAWLLGGASLIGLSGFGGLWFLRRSGSTMERLVASKLDFLDLDRRGLQQFFRDLALESQRGGPALSLFRSYATLLDESSSAKSAEDPSDGIVWLYLRSTDFEANGFDESKQVRYVRLFDPWAPCR